MPQPNKGPRDTATVRMSVPLGTAVRQEAKQRRLTVSDYIATVLAHAMEMPDEAPVRPNKEARLPLTG